MKKAIKIACILLALCLTVLLVLLMIRLPHILHGILTETLRIPTVSTAPNTSTTTEAHIHEFGAWTTVKEANCLEQGVQERTCPCGEKEIQNVDITDHSFSQWVVVKEATEEAEGHNERTCSVCELKESETIPKLEHVHAYRSFWQWRETEHWNTCKCGEVLERGGHTFEEWEVSREANCGREGINERKCTVCDYTERMTLPMVGEHTFGEWQVSKEPSCNYEGKNTRSCTVCGATETAATPRIPHTAVIDEAVKPTCTVDGITEGTHCGVCGVVLIAQATDPAKGHVFENNVCTVCGEKWVDEGLKFTLQEDGTYALTGIGSCKNQEIFIPASYNGQPVTEIKPEAFAWNKSIKKVVIAEGVEKIGYEAFAYCYNVESIVIPESVTYVGNSAFTSCGDGAGKKLNIYISSIEQWLDCRGGNGTGGRKGYSFSLYVDGKLVQDLVLPEGITEVPDSAFRGCNLTSVVVPKGVTKIGGYAFGGCHNLKTVSLPEGLTVVDYSAFFNCVSLQSVILPNTVTTLGRRAFSGCENMRFIVIPSSVKTIGDYAFVECKNLTFYCEAKSKPSSWNKSWNNWNCPVFWGDEWHYVDGFPTPKKS